MTLSPAKTNDSPPVAAPAATVYRPFDDDDINPEIADAISQIQSHAPEPKPARPLLRIVVLVAAAALAAYGISLW
jgi:hypothetical protein